MTAALCLGLAASAAWSAPPPEQARWYDGLLGSKSKTEPKKLPGPPAKTPADRAAEQDRLMKAYLRRLAVCDRLRDVAIDTNNQKLAEEADRLEALAWSLYEKQASRVLGGANGSKLTEEPVEPKTSKTTAASLGSGMPMGPLPARARPGAGLARPNDYRTWGDE